MKFNISIVDYYFNPTYLYSTTGETQIDLRSLQQALPVRNDSIYRLNIKRTQADITHIELPVRQPLKPKINVVPPKKILSPVTLQDSLKFNLTGQKDACTNWNLKPDNSLKLFNKQFYSEINRQLIVSPDSLLNTPSDSLICTESQKPDSLSTSLHESSVQPSNSGSEKNLLQGNNLFLLLILVAVLITGFVRLQWKGYITIILRSVFFQGVGANSSNNNASYNFPSFIMGFLFFFNSTLFIYELFNITDSSPFSDTSLLNIPVIFISLLMLYFAKMLVFRIVGYIFDTSPHIKIYLKGLSTMGQVFATVILPVVILLPFLNQLGQTILIYTGTGLFILLYLLQTMRGIKIILKETLSLYYIILYLCALEILPILVLFKAIFR